MTIDTTTATTATATTTTTTTTTTAEFLRAVFAPEDTILFRPIETWTEAGRKKSRVDYEGIRYHRFGWRPRGEWEWNPIATEPEMAALLARSEAESTNLFFGVCPRMGDGGRFDLAWQIRTVRVLWCDVDDCTPSEALRRCVAKKLPPPSIVVASGHGCHLYWLLVMAIQVDASRPPEVLTEFVDRGDGRSKKRQQYLLDPTTRERLSLDARQNAPALSSLAQSVQDILAGIAARIGGDHTQDLSRLLRLPGTVNRKDQRTGRAPVPCTILEFHPERRYPLEAFAHLADASPSKIRRERVTQVPLPARRKLATRRQDRLGGLIAACAAAEVGQRSEADFALVAFCIEHGQDQDAIWGQVQAVGKFAEAGRAYFDRTWQAGAGHTQEKLFDLASGKQRKKKAGEAPQEGAAPGASPPVDSNLELIESPDDPHRLARVNLERYETSHDGRTLAYWRDEWYTWKQNHYIKITKDELRAKLTGAVRQEFERLNLHEQAEWTPRDDSVRPPETRKVTQALISNVIQATSGMVCVSSSIEPNTWLPTKERSSYVSLENGIVDINAVVANRDDYLIPNSPKWWSMVSLPYAFDPKATCPRWDDFLEFNLEMDPERIKIVQEWAGYLLLSTTDEQKFMILEGEGKNGKSVFIAGLTAMLGEENVSNVSLENFGDRFQLTTTIGKLLNAAGDSGDIDKAAEGILKSFTSGDRMYFDRKGISGLNCVPTARLMVACNNRPRFSDRSDGIYRRMLPIPWRVEVPSERRVKGMDKVTWWQRSGELPGIFRWALVGLARLRAQNGFTESAVSNETLADYQAEMNPARAFLEETCRPCSSTVTMSRELYEQYAKWCAVNGHNRPLSERHFGREVKRRFPLSVRKRETTGTRAWYYTGIDYTYNF